MLPDTQLAIESMYSKTNINKNLNKEILSTEGIESVLEDGIEMLTKYIAKIDTYYESKQKRISQLEILELRDVVISVIRETLLIDKECLFTQIVGQLSAKLGFSNKGDGLKTTAEILAVLVNLNIYNIVKPGKHDSLKFVPLIDPSKELATFLNQVKYLPPMICNPDIVKTNYDSGYLSRKDTLILGGRENFHEENICLDSINKFNQVPLSLKIDLLKTYSEMSKKEITDPEKKEQWQKFVADSYVVYKDLYLQGNNFHLTHKVDKRGRTYAQGYHVNTQGNSFRKAIIELADKEVING